MLVGSLDEKRIMSNKFVNQAFWSEQCFLGLERE